MDEEKTVNQENQPILVVDDGLVRVPIQNKLGEEIGVFMFRPTDVGIVKRFNEVSERFDEVAEPLQKVEMNPDGTGKTDADIEAIDEAVRRLYDLCNYLFGGDFASAFFGKMNPFSPINGVFYCEHALNAVASYISDAFDSEAKKINSRVERYTHGIRTGKHRGGRM